MKTRLIRCGVILAIATLLFSAVLVGPAEAQGSGLVVFHHGTLNTTPTGSTVVEADASVTFLEVNGLRTGGFILSMRTSNRFLIELSKDFADMVVRFWRNNIGQISTDGAWNLRVVDEITGSVCEETLPFGMIRLNLDTGALDQTPGNQVNIFFLNTQTITPSLACPVPGSILLENRTIPSFKQYTVVGRGTIMR